MKTLAIAHLYGNNENLGDWGSAEGVKQQLRAEFNNVEFKDFFISYKDLSDQDINWINTCADLVVIGGGGLLYLRSKGLLLRLSKTSIARIKKPMVLFAVGINYEPHDEHLLEDYLSQFVSIAPQLAKISVRDHLTQDLLKKHGIDSDLVPCPSMFLPPSEYEFPLPDSGKKRVGIVPVPLERFDEAVRKQVLDSIESLVQTHKNQNDFFLLGHNRHIDRAYETLFDCVPLPIINPANPWQLMRAYSQLDFCIGSRGHMGIFALGAGTPFVFLSYNVKCEAFTQWIEYPNTFTLAPETIDPNLLTKTFDQLLKAHDTAMNVLIQKRSPLEQLCRAFTISIKSFLPSV